MIIDNRPIEPWERTTSKLGNHVDTTTNQVVKVQYEVNENILKLATELETLKTLAKSKDTFAEFVTVADKLLEGKYDGKNSLDVIYENKDIFLDTINIELLDHVSRNLDYIKNAADSIETFKEVNGNIESVEAVVEDLLNVDIVAKSIKDVSALANNMERIKTLHHHILKIITLTDSVGELHTIYNHLPYLLRLSKFLTNYYKMAQFIVSKYEGLNKAIDTIILELMELNRDITYQFKNLSDKFDELVKQFEQFKQEILQKFEELVQQFNDLLLKFEELKTIINNTQIGDLNELIKRIEALEAANPVVVKAGTDILVDYDAATKTYTVNADLTGINTGVHTTLVSGDNIVQLQKDDATNQYTISVDQTKITVGDHTKIAAGTNVTVSHDETTNTYTVNSAGGTTELKYTNFTLA